jgi:hypothetical protein
MNQETPPPISPSATAQGVVASLTKSAGAATKLVGLQAERTKLTTITLPAAYRALGKDCIQQKRHLDSVKEMIEQLRAITAELSSLAEPPKADSSQQSLTEKAKAAGKQAVDLARKKQLEMKRESLCGSIGKAIYDNHKESSSSKELVSPIQAALNRITDLDSEIASLSEIGKGSWITPKRILAAAAAVLLLLTISLLSSGKASTQSGSSTGKMYSKYSQQKMGVSWEIAGGPTYDKNAMVEIANKFNGSKSRSSWNVKDAIDILGEPTSIRRFNFASDNPQELNNPAIAENLKARWRSDFDTLTYAGKNDPENNFITLSFRDGLLDESMGPTFNIK